jgi:hypothetical protein
MGSVQEKSLSILGRSGLTRHGGCMPLGGFRRDVDPAVVLVAGYLCGNEVAGGWVAAPIEAVRYD